MEEMFRWLFIGFIAGLWLSLEEAQCKSGTSQGPYKVEHNIRCCSIHPGLVGTDQRQVGDCEDFEIEKLESYCEKSQEDDICKSSGEESSLRPTRVGFPYLVCSADNNQCLCIIPEIQLKSISEKDKMRCFNSSYICCTVCRKDNVTTITIATTNTTTHSIPTPVTAVSGKTGSTSSTTQEPSVSFSDDPTNGFSDYQKSDFSDDQTESDAFSDDETDIQTNASSPSSEGQITQILLIPLVLLVVAFIIVAVILIIRKRKFSGRSEVSSGYETTVRENHYEPSGEGVPIYTELELTQEPAPSNNTVYSSVQPTGEAVDMGRPVVYAELDNVAVVVSPVYSKPFEAEASASNAVYAEPFKPDDKPTSTAPVPNIYYNIAAVDQQSDVYSLAQAIPLSDPNVIYSQPNKPAK